MPESKYAVHKITSIGADGKLVAEDVVVVPITVHARVKLVLGIRYVIVTIAKVFLRISESLLSLAEWITDRGVPAELLLRNQDGDSQEG